MSVKVEFSTIYRKTSQNNLLKGRIALASQAKEDMNRFVPKKENQLRQSSVIAPNGSSIQWTMPYAGVQFRGMNGKAVFQNYSEPGTGKRWDLKAKSVYLPLWKKAYLKGADFD